MDDGRPPANGTALHASVLVLNRVYMAVRIISARRAFALLYKRDAEAIAPLNGDPVGPFTTYDFPAWVERSCAADGAIDHEEFVHTPRWRLMVPRVIRLLDYSQVPRRRIRFSRRSILARDEHRCQYCGRSFPHSQLSLDHVIPRSKGGESTWLNVVASCNACNTRKGGRLPAQAGMALIRKPFAPKRNPLLASRMRQEKYGLWKLFLDDGALAIE
jgi:5-methylcytosine-specific restriction endonuclease McrA